MLVRPLSTVVNTRDYTLVYPRVDSGLTITSNKEYATKTNAWCKLTRGLRESNPLLNFQSIVRF